MRSPLVSHQPSSAGAAQGFLAADVLGLAVGGGGVLTSIALGLWLRPVYAKMYAELSTKLPALTRLYLTPWFPVILSLLPLALVGAGVALRPARGARVSLTTAAIMLAMLLQVAHILALYLPIFTLADAISE